MTVTFNRHSGSAATTQQIRNGRIRTFTKTIAERTYLPVCFLTLGAAVLIAIGWISRWGGANFTGTLLSIRVSVIGPETLVIIAILMIAE
ncbi:MAG: hypothetical protein ABI298_01675 [Acidimicrobiales bacterium]